MSKYVYMIIDRTDGHHTRRFRSAHSSLESAQNRMSQYVKNYHVSARGLVEIIKVCVED